MIVGSVCSGIEAATVAWKPLGFRFAWYSEIEPFCCSLLKHYYPDTPNLGDITAITEADLEQYEPIDVLVGGTPCQSFSVAGLRKGLDDPRGNLALRFLQLVDATRPRWVVWENVPGVLSSWTDEATFAPSEESCRAIREAGLDPEDFEEVEQTSDYKCFLDALSELGYGWAYRILDAQYFGVPQRRRRVFVVGYLGDWRRAAAILFDRESMSGNPPPSREKGAGVAAILEVGARTGGRPEEMQRDGIGIGGDGDPMFTLQAGKQHGVACYGGNNTAGPIAAAAAVNAHPSRRLDFESETLVVAQNGSDIQVGNILGAVTAGMAKQTSGDLVATPTPAVAYRDDRDDRGRGNDRALEDVTYPLHGAKGQSEQQCVAYQCHGSNVGPMGAMRAGNGNEHGGVPFVSQSMAVRRLLPVECERLQGFPDNYTNIPYGRPKYPDQICPDGPRYKALGNAMAVPVMMWIGRRMKMISHVTEGYFSWT
jgi:DNA (cytosine-5)-methyltransferase 1